MSEAEAEETARCDFLLATRIQYERRVVPSPRSSRDAEQPAAAGPDLRAAEFLLVNRARAEATRRRTARRSSSGEQPCQGGGP